MHTMPDRALQWGTRVRVIDPESPMFGWEGKVETQTDLGRLFVRFPGSLMQFDRAQVERVRAPGQEEPD